MKWNKKEMIDTIVMTVIFILAIIALFCSMSVDLQCLVSVIAIIGLLWMVTSDDFDIILNKVLDRLFGEEA